MADGKQGNGQATRARETALARAELKRGLARAKTANERLDLLISHPKGEAVIPTLPAEDLYFTMKDVGLSDSVELVRLASPEQFRAFVDLDAWRRDHLDPASALLWLRAAGTDDDEQRFRKKIHALDVEVLELVLRSTTHVHDLEEDPDPEPEGPTFRSPEGHFLVEFKVEGAEYAGVKRLLDELYAEDPFRTARLLEAVRWEVPAELEETAYRWRNGRMQDLGFPELGEALSFFAWRDPDSALPVLEKAPPVPDSFLLARAEPQGRFFDRAAALVSEEGRAILERQLVTVLNAYLVVEAVDPGDGEQVQRALATARDALSLGLEHAAKGDPAVAATLLATASLKTVFQTGISLALRLKYRADRLMKAGRASLPGSKDEPLLDAPLDAVVTSLRRKRPQYAASLDDARAPPERQRGFRDRADLERVAQALGDAEETVEILSALGFAPDAAARLAATVRPAESLASLRYSDFLLTAVARELVGESFAFAALSPEKLGKFADAAFVLDGGKPVAANAARALEARIAKATGAQTPARAQAAARLVDVCVKRLVEEMGEPWALGTLEPEPTLPLLLGK